MNKKKIRIIVGILFLVAGVYLMKTPIYTSIKGAVINSGGNVILAIAVAMGLITIAFVSGIAFLGKSKNFYSSKK